MNPSGLRIGTPALTTRGMGEDEMREIARSSASALGRFDSERDALLERTRALMERTRCTRSSRPRRSRRLRASTATAAAKEAGSVGIATPARGRADEIHLSGHSDAKGRSGRESAPNPLL